MSAKKGSHDHDAVDRRSGADRRRVDSGLPRKYERRRGVEPRRPEVVELEMSDSEFMVFGEALPPPAG